MPGAARSDMGLGRISMSRGNPMPGGSRSDMGLGCICAMFALMEPANRSRCGMQCVRNLGNLGNLRNLRNLGNLRNLVTCKPTSRPIIDNFMGTNFGARASTGATARGEGDIALMLSLLDALFPYSIGTREDKKSRAWPVGAQAQARDSVNIASSGVACLILSWISSLHSSIASLCDIALM